MNSPKQKAAAPFSVNGSFVFGALARLSLLVGPETAVVKLMGHSPVLCILAAIAVLAIWMTVDVGPFRATAPQRPTSVKKTGFVRNIPKAQWWSYLFCRMVIIFAVFHSRLTTI